MYIWDVKTQIMRKQLLFVFFLFFSFLNVANATERDSIVAKKFVTPPVNDECSGAINVPVNPTLEVVTSILGSTVDATISAGFSTNPCVGVSSYQQDVWLSFTATAKRHIVSFSNISVSNKQIYYSIYSGSCSNLEIMYCGQANNPEMSAFGNLIVGANYKIRVVVQNNTPLTFDIALTTPASVPNDECSAAIVVPVNPTLEATNFITGDWQGASTSASPVGCFEDSNKDDMWYKFVATSKQHIITFDLSQGIYFYIDLFSGSTCAGSVHMTCWSDSVYLLEDLTIGTTYRLKVTNGYFAGITPAIFNLSITTPPTIANDDCATLINIPVNPSVEGLLFAEGTSFGANSSGLPDICYGDYNDVWFDFTAISVSQIITIYDFDQSVVGIRYGLYTGNCNELVNVGCSTLSSKLFNNLVVGNNYKVRVQNYLNSSFLAGAFKIAVTTPPIPSNDNCENAVNITVNPNPTSELFMSGTTYAATASPEPSTCSGTENDDVWFSFVAQSTIQVVNLLNITGTTTNIRFAVYSGTECSTMTQVFCSLTDRNNTVITNLAIGETYKIRVYTNGNSSDVSASFDISITTPLPITNDECINAIPLTVNEGLDCIQTAAVSVTGATASPQVSTCAGMEDDDVWFSFVATGTSCIINFQNIIGSAIILNSSLYSGDDCGNLTFISCNNYNQTVANNLIPGTTYKLRVWSNSTLLEDIQFTICIASITPPIFANTTQYTVPQLVNEVLINNACSTIANITWGTGTTTSNGIGYFNKGNSDFPFEQGIILSTGNAAAAAGPNTSILSGGGAGGDADLSAILATQTPPVTGALNNATKLEFDFVAVTNQINFNFLFASEEYGVFQCGYADAFAFILTDLTAGTPPMNLAILPGTNIPVSVVNIRDNQYNTGCPSNNVAYFGNYYNNTAGNLGAPINFNGITVPMTAGASVIPGNSYHIKMVIADYQDTAYDSAVFLQGGSFNPGEESCLDRINLIAFNDTNNNGIKEETETSFTYGSFKYQLNDTPEIHNLSSPIGSYTIFDQNPLNSYDFTFSVHPEYATYFSAGTTSYTNISIAPLSGSQTLYFPITQIQGYNDVTVAIIPSGQPVAGFDYNNKIVFNNLGSMATSGTITYTKNPAVTITSVSSDVTLTPTGFTYSFTNLAAFETQLLTVSLSVPSIPVVNINDVLTSSVTISAPIDDLNTNNNSFSIVQTVGASYDPNDKMEAHGAKLDFDTFSQDDYLFYTIRFQNTGTTNAINIRIEDLLDEQLDEESMRMVSSSHNYLLERVGSQLVWKFNGINLPSIIQNEELSKGHLTFKVKVKPGFELGDIIPNYAEIYFDTNPAIITNTFNSEFEIQLSAPEFTAGNINVYPNPSKGLVYINVQNTSENLNTIQLYDVLGKRVLTSKSLTSQQSTIDVSALAKGVYMLEITTESNLRQTKKLVVH